MAKVEMDYTTMGTAASEMDAQIQTMTTIQTKIGELIDELSSTGFGSNAAIAGKLATVKSTNDGIIKTVVKDCTTMSTAMAKVAKNAKEQEETNADAYKSYAGSTN